ncbi:MAG TPA: hypothetical protein VGP92_16220 [Acidimicrobiia bacterium]|nr:hypothetical protein [Acidimicrobiia bacterium]
MTAPAPAVPVGAARSATVPSAEEQFFAPAVLQAAAARPRARSGSASGTSSEAGKWIVLAAMVGFFVVAIAVAAITIRSTANTKQATPVVLAPRAPVAGLTTDLSVIVRIQAESTRHTALQAVAQVGAADLGALASVQPGYQWVAGNQPSTDARVISVAENAGTVTIAVAASNHDICAFGQFTPATVTVQYVTMAHVASCAAANAPSAGWSSEAGGSASDLPDANG